jgi:hypothetical protein
MNLRSIGQRLTNELFGSWVLVPVNGLVLPDGVVLTDLVGKH